MTDDNTTTTAVNHLVKIDIVDNSTSIILYGQIDEAITSTQTIRSNPFEGHFLTTVRTSSTSPNQFNIVPLTVTCTKDTVVVVWYMSKITGSKSLTIKSGESEFSHQTLRSTPGFSDVSTFPYHITEYVFASREISSDTLTVEYTSVLSTVNIDTGDITDIQRLSAISSHIANRDYSKASNNSFASISAWKVVESNVSSISGEFIQGGLVIGKEIIPLTTTINSTMNLGYNKEEFRVDYLINFTAFYIGQSLSLRAIIPDSNQTLTQSNTEELYIGGNKVSTRTYELSFKLERDLYGNINTTYNVYGDGLYFNYGVPQRSYTASSNTQIACVTSTDADKDTGYRYISTLVAPGGVLWTAQETTRLLETPRPIFYTALLHS
jgi:hypothetical protein